MDYPGDILDSIATTASIGSDDRVTSQIETADDRDWFRVELTAGQTYTFELNGVGSTATELRDSALTLFHNGVSVAYDDISGPGLDSLIEFTPSESGTYHLQAAGYASNTGEYELVTSVRDISGTSILPAIDWGTQVDTQDISVYFGAANETFANISGDGWNAYEIQQAMAVFAHIETLVDITFTQVFDATDADFTLMTQNFASYSGLMYPPGLFYEGVGAFSRSADGWDEEGGGGLEQGGRGFQLMLHELGHGLGLAHPHDTGGTSERLNGVTSAFNDYGSFNLNQGIFTNMSYNDGYPLGESVTPTDDYGSTGTFSPLDIALLQQKYGANTTYESGDSSYVLPSDNAPGTFYSALWDTGGTDEITYAGTANATIDLRAATLVYEEGGGGFVSRVEGINGGFTIAHGVIIEGAQTGAGDDRITGNNADNLLNAGDGDDTVYGRNGDDSIHGGNGDDLLVGNAGSDALFGGNGNDRLAAGTGQDRLYGEDGDDLLIATSGHNALLGGRGDDYIRGGSDTDILRGNAGNDTLLDTLGGADNLDGGAGNDTLSAGSGDDYLHGGTGRDRLAGGGHNDELHGGAGNDVVLGQAGHDILRGGGGADILKGATGNDTLRGDGGADRFYFSDGDDRDVILDFADDSDTIYLDSDLWGGRPLDAAGVVSGYATASGADIVFDFGGGDTLTILNTTLTQIEDDLVIL